MDKKYMKRAIELSKKGAGFTNPNPLVGAVIVKNDRIIGEGYHKQYGSNHAEVEAFENATEDVNGSTMYVTLEPCSHYGNTPPCVDAIVKNKISKVVIGMVDPNPLVAGRGIKILEDNGIEVITGVLENKVKKINEIFIKYIKEEMPFLIMKTAMTLDGKIASHTGDSKWISNQKSREFTHEIRNRVAAILVGINTVINDNPKLTTRLNGKDGKDPIRVIVDSNARIPIDAKVINNDSDSITILATTGKAKKEKLDQLKDIGVEVIVTPLKDGRVDLKYLLKKLGGLKIDSILIEGGGTINFSFLKEKLVDKVYSFISPKLIGGKDALTPVEGKGIEKIDDAILVENMNIKKIDNDILIESYVKKG